MNLRELAGDLGVDEATVRRLLETFLRTSDADLGRLAQAVGAGEAARVTELAHHIKGAAANLDLESIRGSAEELERAARAGALEGAEAVLARLSGELSHIRETLG